MDRSELWKIHAVLGMHRHPDWWRAAIEDGTGHSDQTAREVPSRPSDNVKRSRDLFAARRRAARGEGPPPEPRAANPMQVMALAQAMNG